MATVYALHAKSERLRIFLNPNLTRLHNFNTENGFTPWNHCGVPQTKNIIELMGGSIGVESQPGEGSTFWIELPGVSDNIADEKLETVNSESKKSSVAEKQNTSDTEYKNTLLYIEDNPANLRLVTQLLGRITNIHMWSAHEPMLGLELAMEHQPDLILLDINLPGIDGYEVLRRLRSWDATRDIPVIAISANAMPKDIENSKEAGFDDYITKPIDLNRLLVTVEDQFSEINKQ